MRLVLEDREAGPTVSLSWHVSVGSEYFYVHKNTRSSSNYIVTTSKVIQWLSNTDGRQSRELEHWAGAGFKYTCKETNQTIAGVGKHTKWNPFNQHITQIKQEIQNNTQIFTLFIIHVKHFNAVTQVVFSMFSFTHIFNHVWVWCIFYTTVIVTIKWSIHNK